LDYPSLLNDNEVHDHLLSALDSVFGKQNIIETEALLGGEDFAFFSRKVPAMFYFLGARDKVKECFFVYNPRMVVDEDCIRVGSMFLVEASIALLNFYAENEV